MRADDRGPLFFNLLIWSIMLIAAIGLIVARGSNVPSWDDWDNVPVLTGHQPLTIEWLWSEHNEHRDPLPRLIIVALNRFIKLDFRTAMYFNALATGAIALALMLAVRFARGRASYFDSFLPIVLLHFGQSENILWGWQVQFYASALLACGVLVCITRIRSPRDRSLLYGAALCVPMLALCGANGLVLVIPLAIWLGYAAFAILRAQSASRAAILMALACAVSMIVVGCYFVNYHAVPYHPEHHTFGAMISTAIKFLTMSFGPGVVGLSSARVPMPLWQVVSFGMTLLFLATALLLMVVWLRDRAERLRSAGLFFFLGAMGAIALAMGLGREGFEPRYVILSVPVACVMYIAWSIYGSTRWREIIPAAMTAVALAALIPNTLFGLRYAHYLKSNLQAFETEMIAGAPMYRLIHNHNEYLHPHDQVLMDYLPMLRDAHVGAFVHLRDNPPFREIHIPLDPTLTYDMRWNDGTAVATGIYPFAIFTLPKPIDVAGIRIRYNFTSDTAIAPYFMIYWRANDDAEFPKANYKKFTPTGDYANWKQGTWSRLNDTTTKMEVWPCDQIKSIKVCMFSTLGTTKFYEITLLVPENSAESISQTSSPRSSHLPARR